MLLTTAKIAPPPAPRYQWPRAERPDPVTDANRIISDDPIYDLAKVREMIKKHGFVVLNDDTDEAKRGRGRNPLPAPAWSDEEFEAVIMSLTENDHENAQWCALNVNTYLDCDSYVIRFSRSRKKRSSDPQQGIKLYVKFGFFPNGSKAVICRLHPAY
ncbi:hypothetical protein LK540_10995 [Massilia sp. IC2-278]|uniref:hypothetical protein n=1 Tax=Massilia sp. IC2-278 TaxID=2887200 RepID=UPI001E30E7DE|nr:hypothetical protein [Massilia sp. IC2-278]MCC2960949.1 hypothetical protein [Massilia sp. IC2-278]